MQNVEHPN